MSDIREFHPAVLTPRLSPAQAAIEVTQQSLDAAFAQRELDRAEVLKACPEIAFVDDEIVFIDKAKPDRLRLTFDRDPISLALHWANLVAAACYGPRGHLRG